MIASVFNNTNGGGKSTFIYTLLLYLDFLNLKRSPGLYDFYDDGLLFHQNDSVRKNYHDFKHYFKEKENSGHEVYNKFSSMFSGKSINIFNTVGQIDHTHYVLYLYSRFIIIPVGPTYYYRNNIYSLMNVIKEAYIQKFVPNPNMDAMFKNAPSLILVPMHSEIPSDVKTIFKDNYIREINKIYFIDRTYPFCDYSKILNYDPSSEGPISDVNKAVCNILFNL